MLKYVKMENIFINKCNELKLNSDQTELALIFFQLGNKSNNFNYKFKDEIIEDCPKFVGKLNKKFGYNGFKPIEVGTDVYEFNNSYYFEMIKEFILVLNKIKIEKLDHLILYLI